MKLIHQICTTLLILFATLAMISCGDSAAENNNPDSEKPQLIPDKEISKMPEWAEEMELKPFPIKKRTDPYDRFQFDNTRASADGPEEEAAIYHEEFVSLQKIVLYEISRTFMFTEMSLDLSKIMTNFLADKILESCQLSEVTDLAVGEECNVEKGVLVLSDQGVSELHEILLKRFTFLKNDPSFSEITISDWIYSMNLKLEKSTENKFSLALSYVIEGDSRTLNYEWSSDYSTLISSTGSPGLWEMRIEKDFSKDKIILSSTDYSKAEDTSLTRELTEDGRVKIIADRIKIRLEKYNFDMNNDAEYTTTEELLPYPGISKIDIKGSIILSEEREATFDLIAEKHEDNQISFPLRGKMDSDGFIYSNGDIKPSYQLIMSESSGHTTDQVSLEGIFYSDNGESMPVIIRGPADAESIVIFLHGGPSSILTEDFYEDLISIYPNQIVVSWQQRSAGGSFGPRYREINLKSMYTDLDELTGSIKNKFPNKKIILHGGSWGGGYALHYALSDVKNQEIAGIVDQVGSFAFKPLIKKSGEKISYFSNIEKDGEYSAYWSKIKQASNEFSGNLDQYTNEEIILIYYSLALYSEYILYQTHDDDPQEIPGLLPEADKITIQEILQTVDHHDYKTDSRESNSRFQLVSELYDLKEDWSEELSKFDTDILFLYGDLDLRCPSLLVSDYLQPKMTSLSDNQKQLITYENKGHSFEISSSPEGLQAFNSFVENL